MSPCTNPVRHVVTMLKCPGACPCTRNDNVAQPDPLYVQAGVTVVCPVAHSVQLTPRYVATGRNSTAAFRPSQRWLRR